jgi:transcriptional regulator with PAS, ATPase and Fis domain
VTVHVCGESGVGKELVADALHHLSPRHAARFVKVNCSAIPSTLLESALFGHVRGAFTDAHRDQQGYIEYAHGGTVFLDEIGEVSHEMQVKLLRLLQSHEYNRVGEAVTRKADIRIITATNRDLEELVAQGKIREDFYYRINVFPLRIPPLRSRKSDIADLSRFFIDKFNKCFSKNITGLSQEVQTIFEKYSWPGNIRELENTIEHAFVIAQSGLIELRHLPQTIANSGVAGLSRGIESSMLALSSPSNAQDECKLIASALSRTNGNRTRAAKLLGVSRVTLWKKLRKFHINELETKGELNEQN